MCDIKKHTMKDKLLEVSKNPSSYYYEVTPTNPIKNPKQSHKFIEEYLIRGRKENLLNVSFYEKYLDNGKHVHTASLYFLGILLKPIINVRLNTYLKKIIPDITIEDRYTFEYIWFLVCLYHDFGSVEEDQYKRNFLIHPSDLDYILEKYDIQNNIFDHELKSNFKTHHTPEGIKGYLKLRGKDKKNDHGILGGLLFYDRLIGNYSSKWTSSQNSQPNGTFESFRYEERNWRIEHHEIFACLSYVLMSHNIWRQEKGIVTIFKLDNNMENGHRVSLECEPLLFFFGLLDTIEPTKFFDQLNPECVWESLDIHYEVESRCISVTVLNNCINYKKWFDKIKGLEDWLDVSIRVPTGTDNNKIEIRF